MKLNFTGEIQELRSGMEILCKRLGLQLDSAGMTVKVSKRDGDLELKKENEDITIFYQDKIHFYRALGLLREKLCEGTDQFHIKETPNFETNGIMVDCSRNAVMSVDSVKDTIELMAIMGLNMLMLYTEDTYEVKSRPYFGYMRGRFTQAELKECDDYADVLGVEIIPCIQTLAHLTQALKWDVAGKIRDTIDILLIDEPATYEFIEDMIKSASEPLRSKRVHLGMDEAHFVGLGNYLLKHGYKDRFEIMNNHLKKVCNISEKYGLKPMIWSDMYFRLASETGEYYDVESIPQRVIDILPKGVQMVYWDYYHHKEEDYKRLITQHQNLGLEMVFAGGIWVWNGTSTNYDQTFVSTNAALAACKSVGAKEVFATMWGDNGAETCIYEGLLGLQLFAEHGYSQDVDNDRLKERFKACTNLDMDDFLALNDFDNVGRENNLGTANPAKWLLWQDVLIGLFDEHVVDGVDYSDYYRKLAMRMNAAVAKSGEYGFIFEKAEKLAAVLALKADLGVKLKAVYDSKNLPELSDYAQVLLPELRMRVEELREAHMRQWLATSKPFGWEVLDLRYGGLLSRIDTAIFRLIQYLNGDIDSIPELGAERLSYNGVNKAEKITFPRENLYHRIASASNIIGV